VILSYVLFAYLIFLIAFGLVSWAGLYHLYRFGYAGDKTRLIINVYLAVSIVVIVLSLTLFLVSLYL